ncbi:MAG: hypothetical protein LBT92_03135, partial [Rickettsiales bacterium]|nr:hypothetical protein [Rickettsiales bacterium]
MNTVMGNIIAGFMPGRALRHDVRRWFVRHGNRNLFRDSRFKIPEGFSFFFDSNPVRRYRLVDMHLSDIRRHFPGEGTTVGELSPCRLLDTGDRGVFSDYLVRNAPDLCGKRLDC